MWQGQDFRGRRLCKKMKGPGGLKDRWRRVEAADQVNRGKTAGGCWRRMIPADPFISLDVDQS